MTTGETPEVCLRGWIARLEAAVGSGRADRIADLFIADGFWRDVLAFTWAFRTFSGAGEIGAAIGRLAGVVRPTGFEINTRYPIQRKTWLGREVVEGIIDFAITRGRASAVVRLVETDGEAKAWLLVTHLDELTGFEERIGARRPRNTPSLATARGERWPDRRRRAVAYADREPTVLIVGGGQAGLALSARLNALAIDNLVVDRIARIGDNWRNRYDALTLHNEIVTSHLPYLPFPETWPYYVPKDQLADWFEFYAAAMEVNFWTSTEFVSAAYDDAQGRWNATLRQGEETRVLHPRHIVLASGLSGEPFIPPVDGLGRFEGEVLHSTQYEDSSRFRGKHVVVFGAGNSGHDIAQDLHGAAASVTMVQKSPIMVINCEPTAQTPNTSYRAGWPTDLVDKAGMFNPYPLFLQAAKMATGQMREMDEALTAGLEAAGFRTGWGMDDTGFLPLYYTKGGGFYFNVGCSDLITQGKVRVIQAADIAEFAADRLMLRDGAAVEADAIVMATGFRDLNDLVRRKFGGEVADRIGPVWGFDDNGEVRNVWRRTAQPGLWFHVGSLPQARCMSKPLALQILAIEQGLIEARAPAREAALGADGC